jgi:short-subunit dehydrogenase involved in D-alanine esterification of teichoic acids
VHIFPVDLSTRQGSKAMIEAATAKMGGIDVLVLNHIIGMYDDWAAHVMNGHASGEIDQSMDWVDKLFKVNILSYIYISSYALPELAESGSGRIIAVGSMAGRQGLARVAPYASTKHAMFGYFDSLRQDILASPDPKVRSIRITTGVLGAFSTETARAGTAGKLDDGMVVSDFFFPLTPVFFLSFIFSFFSISFFFFSSPKPWNDPSVASHDLIKASAREWQTVYTPWHQLRVAALLHGFAPELMEKIVLHVTLSGEVKK